MKFSDYCGPIRKKSYHYVSGMVEMACNISIKEIMRDCYFVYERAKLLRFLLSRIPTITKIASQQIKLRLLLEEKMTAPSIPKSVYSSYQLNIGSEAFKRVFVTIGMP